MPTSRNPALFPCSSFPCSLFPPDHGQPGFSDLQEDTSDTGERKEIHKGRPTFERKGNEKIFPAGNQLVASRMHAER